jgi:hypothetical protein
LSQVLDEETVIAQTRCWIERVVMQYNLCPFAHKPVQGGQVRYRVSEAKDPEALVQELIDELETLRASDAQQVETTVLIHPYVLEDFLDYNDFLDVVDQLLEQGGYADDFQVASLHPDYQFADTGPDDAENYTNRSPYPVLHLLREASVDRVLEKYPDPDAIPGRNIETMNRLGVEQIRQILHECMQVGDK